MDAVLMFSITLIFNVLVPFLKRVRTLKVDSVYILRIITIIVSYL